MIAVLAVLLNGSFCLAVRSAQPAGILLGIGATPVPGVDFGEILLGELNCVACHAATDSVKARLASKDPPLLTEAGSRITPQYLRAFLLNPHGEKPGTSMPDLLHDLSSTRKAETVEALVHFLASLKPSSDSRQTTAVAADEFKIKQGRELYHKVGCVACHEPQEPPSEIAAKRSEDESSSPGANIDLATLRASSVPLGNLARKVTVEQLAQFLTDPLRVQPSGRMPSLNLSEAEATAISMYLLRDQAPALSDPSKPKQKLKGLTYEYFEARMSEVPNFDEMKITSTGAIDRFTLEPRKRNSQFALRFSGLITVATNGTYTFYTDSDDGSRLYVGDKLVVQNDGLHGATEKKGTIELAPGDHPILVTYFNGDADYVLKVSWQGPGFRKREIPANVLSHIGVPMVPLGSETFVVDAAKSARGQKLFGSLGCASCHQVGVRQSKIVVANKAKPLANLNPRASRGCLGQKPKKGVPQFALDSWQREVLRAAVGNRAKFRQPLSANDQVKLAMARFNCYACHARDGIGGPDTSGKGDYFLGIGEADLGDEGRIPPHLTKVGGKLRPERIGAVLWDKDKVRPYMATRMPQFGKQNIAHLASLFEKADSAAEGEAPVEVSERDAKWGRKLVGREGLTCIACHRFGKYESLGIPAIDLTVVTKRLKREWFHRYLIDPASLRPGTRMPTFWPEGHAANKEILEGDTDKQINAIWAYLSKGAEADVPLGMVRAKKEIVAGNEAVIYRHFIQGAGSRAIGVGFPEKANLAFDANDMRLALIWQGAFIDASRHSTDRGDGFEPPLGDRVLKLPAGPPFAILDKPDAPWPADSGKKAGYQFQGYRLDEKRRPAFLYSFGDIRIEDYSLAMAGELDPKLARTITLRGPDRNLPNLFYRAAVGNQIEKLDDQSYVVDGKLNLKFHLTVQEGPALKSEPRIRRIDDKAELIVPVRLKNGEGKIVEEMIW